MRCATWSSPTVGSRAPMPPTGPSGSTRTAWSSPRARRSAHPSARARRGAQGDGRDGHARGGRRWLHGGGRDGEHRSGDRPRGDRARGPDLAAEAGSCDVYPIGAITKGLAGESLAEMGEMVEAGVRVFSDDGRCVPDAGSCATRSCTRERSRSTSCSRTTPRTPHWSRAARCTRDRCRYALGLAGRPAEAEEIVGRSRPGGRSCGGRPAPSVPPVERAGGGARPAGQGRGRARHRGGDAAPPGVHRRGPRHLRHRQEDEPAAAKRRGPRRAPRGCGRRHDRRDRDRPRPPRGRGEGQGVRRRAPGDDRARDRARRRADASRGAGHHDPAARDRGSLDHAGADPRRGGARRPARDRQRREPGRLRSR